MTSTYSSIQSKPFNQSKPSGQSKPSSQCKLSGQSKSSGQPSQHLIALVTFFALIPLVYFIPDLVANMLPPIKWLNVVVAVGIIVPIISYLVIPFSLKLTALFRKPI